VATITAGSASIDTTNRLRTTSWPMLTYEGELKPERLASHTANTMSASCDSWVAAGAAEAARVRGSSPRTG